MIIRIILEDGFVSGESACFMEEKADGAYSV